MSAYRVQYTHRAHQNLRNLPLKIAKKTITKIDEIVDMPYTHIKKLKRPPIPNVPYTHSVSGGMSGLKFSIHDDALIIHVLEIDPRKHVYRDF